jgi:hypothetical protein
MRYLIEQTSTKNSYAGLFLIAMKPALCQLTFYLVKSEIICRTKYHPNYLGQLTSFFTGMASAKICE